MEIEFIGITVPNGKAKWRGYMAPQRVTTVLQAEGSTGINDNRPDQTTVQVRFLDNGDALNAFWPRMSALDGACVSGYVAEKYLHIVSPTKWFKITGVYSIVGDTATFILTADNGWKPSPTYYYKPD